MKGILAGQVALGGNPNQYTFFMVRDNFTDMETGGPAIAKALAEAKLTPIPGVVLNMENWVISRIPELTLSPAAQ